MCVCVCVWGGGGGGGGRENLCILHLKQSCFSYGEGSVKYWTFHEKETLTKTEKLNEAREK